MLFVPLLVVQAHQPDDGAGIAVLGLTFLLGVLIPYFALIMARKEAEAKHWRSPLQRFSSKMVRWSSPPRDPPWPPRSYDDARRRGP